MSDKTLSLASLSKIAPTPSSAQTLAQPQTLSTVKTPKICLNMIVKNESRIILRLLETVLPLIDGYCICDTGSTDNTKELITDFFVSKGIPGKIVEEPFRDFGYNRTFALNACKDMADMDYVLLLDADMKLTGPGLQQPELFKKSLTCDMYHIFQGNNAFYYKNARIARNNRGYTYWGVTHEYVNQPQGTTTGTIERDLLFIHDIGDGGAKGDKTERDIRLLKKGLEDLPNNDRYTFYLANSYRDAGHLDEAIDTYKKRIQIGGWIEEIWFSYYSIGNCYMRKGDEANAIFWWMAGYNAYNRRVENLYKIVEHYRTRGKNQLAYEFYQMADKARTKYTSWSDYLFLERDIYDYKLDYEMSIVGYYVNDARHDMCRCSTKVLDCKYAEDGIRRNVMSNYKFYVDHLVKHSVDSKYGELLAGLNSIHQTCATILGIDMNEFVSSTPSIVWVEGTYGFSAEGAFAPNTPSLCSCIVVNVRFVNYRIDDRGGYVNKDHITTINVLAKYDCSTGKLAGDPVVLKYNSDDDAHYVGLEDVRLFSSGSQLFYNANRGLDKKSQTDVRMAVEHGRVDIDTHTCTNSVYLKRDGAFAALEKNWVLFEDRAGQTKKMVYSWSPLVIGSVVGDNFVESVRDASVPGCFKDLRGSTNGVVVDDEIWFICHCVSYEDRRYYYHMMVALDAITFRVRRYTPMFSFEKEKVEYTLGFIVLPVEGALRPESNLLIGYSTYDRCTKYITVPKSYFENQFIQCEYR